MTTFTGALRIVAASIDADVEQRDDHLHGNDFFDMPGYPEITFTSTAVEPAGADTYRVTGT